MKHYRVLIFDWDGTIIDSIGHIVVSVQEIAKIFGQPVPSADSIRQGIGQDAAAQVRRLLPGIPLEEGIAAVKRHYATLAGTVSFFDGAIETLRQLHQAQFRLAIATSKSRAGLERDLKQGDIRDLFVTSRCPEDGYLKPDRRILDGILQEIGEDHDSAIMIGDTQYDMRLANNAGVDCLAVGYGVDSLAGLQGYEPVAGISRISELVPLLIGGGRLPGRAGQ